MRLYHFSDDPEIELFAPRPVRVPAERRPGFAWLNGPLVWAIDEAHRAMYLFPRDCPRILLWRTPDTTDEDAERFWQGSGARTLVYIERAWLERVQRATLYRYELPPEPFEPLHDAGMWVSRQPVTPLCMDTLGDLRAEHAACGTELRVLDSLLPLKNVWDSSLHASGLRLRNARGWGAPGWPHSPPRR